MGNELVAARVNGRPCGPLLGWSGEDSLPLLGEEGYSTGVCLVPRDSVSN